MGEGLGSFLSLIGPFTAQVRWFLGCGEVHLSFKWHLMKRLARKQA